MIFQDDIKINSTMQKNHQRQTRQPVKCGTDEYSCKIKG